MTYPDPFAGQPADEAQPTPAAAPSDPWANQTAVQAPVSPHTPTAGDASLTLKGGGYDGPWLVLHDTLENIDDILNGERSAVLKRVLDRAQLVATAFQASAPGVTTSGSAHKPAQRQSAPAAAQQPPANAPACPAPGWVYRSGMKKDGSGTYQAWFPPRGDSSKPLFFD
jgi:hypothetical protein